MSSYSISFVFHGNVRTTYIELPIENILPDSPAARYIRKQLESLNCEIIRHTYFWGCRKSPSRSRWCRTPAIEFTGPELAMHYLVKLYGFPGQEVPTKPTAFFHDKFLWRYVVRPLFPLGTGTPVTVNTSHLAELESILLRIDEFTSSSYSVGRVHYGGISSTDLAGLPHLIAAIKEDGHALVCD